jgi:hypothetical protein
MPSKRETPVVQNALERGEQYRQPRPLPVAVRLPAEPDLRPALPLRESHPMAERAPERLYPAVGGGARGGESNGPWIQRSATGSSPDAPPAAGTQAAANQEQDSGAADPAAAANEIHLLANEVWYLLKRRLAVEAERRGG